MNRRHCLAPVYKDLLDIFGDDLGRPMVALLDVVAAHEDERDDIIGRALQIEGYEWRADA